jgi:hypothetical protein
MFHCVPTTQAWRLIVLRRDASELLVFRSVSEYLMPEVDIPTHSRVAPALNAEIKKLWNVEAYSLHPLPADSQRNDNITPRYHIVEALQNEAVPPEGALWISLRDALDSRLLNSEDSAALLAWLDHLTRKHSNSGTRPFEKPGWFSWLKDWVQYSIRPCKLVLTGPFQQLNASSSFSLIRFETNGAPVWFKAVGEPNEREFSITVALSQVLSPYTPHVLATYPPWNAWLTLEARGLRLAQTESVLAWINAARDLAQMQVMSIDMDKEIEGCGFRDLRIDRLLVEIEPFFTCLAHLMSLQTSTQPSRLYLEELRQLEIATREALLQAQEAGVPKTVGHLDLNPENIVALPESTVFLDWAEGSIGYPFFSFAHLLEHFRRSFDGSGDCEAQLIEAYAGVWNTQQTFKHFRDTLALSAFLAVFAHAVSTDPWRDVTKLRELHLDGYYRSLARRMKRYRDRLRSGVSDVSEVMS